MHGTHVRTFCHHLPSSGNQFWGPGAMVTTSFRILHLAPGLCAKAFLKFTKPNFQVLSYCQSPSQDHSSDDRAPGVNSSSVVQGVKFGRRQTRVSVFPWGTTFQVSIKTLHSKFKNSSDTPENSFSHVHFSVHPHTGSHTVSPRT